MIHHASTRGLALAAALVVGTSSPVVAQATARFTGETVVAAPARPASQVQPAVARYVEPASDEPASEDSAGQMKTFPFAPPEGPVIIYLPPGALPTSVQAWPGGWQKYAPAFQDQQWPISPRNGDPNAKRGSGALLPWPDQMLPKPPAPGTLGPAARLTQSPGLFGSGGASAQAPQPTPASSGLMSPPSTAPQPASAALAGNASRGVFGPARPEQNAAVAPPPAAGSVLVEKARQFLWGGNDRTLANSQKGVFSRPFWAGGTQNTNPQTPPAANVATTSAPPLAPGSKGMFARPAWLGPPPTAVAAQPPAAPSAAPQPTLAAAQPSSAAGAAPAMQPLPSVSAVQQASATSPPTAPAQSTEAFPVAAVNAPAAAQPTAVTSSPTQPPAQVIPTQDAQRPREMAASPQAGKFRRNPLRETADANTGTLPNPLR